MNYSKEQVMQFVEEEDVKFIRLAFCDVLGVQKNVSIMASELDRAFSEGIAIDASAIEGFGDEAQSDIFLHPDPDTLAVLPWRPEHGKVVRMFCDVTRPNGGKFECDTRAVLKKAVDDAAKQGLSFEFGPEMEFYLFKTDEDGNPTKAPYDNAGYMDIAPDDKGENVRREICLTLERMGIYPESSHHEEGPGQNEIDFRYTPALQAADNALTFRSVVKTIAGINGLYADFSPKPLALEAGNGFHINVSATSKENLPTIEGTVAGILSHISEMTLFLNPSENSYKRLGKCKAPAYIAWSDENRSPLIRIPAAAGNKKRVELRSPDPLANPYIAFALIIYAALDGIASKTPAPKKADFNFFRADEDVLKGYDKIPLSLKCAADKAKNSAFIANNLPKPIVEYYLKTAEK